MGWFKIKTDKAQMNDSRAGGRRHKGSWMDWCIF